MFVDLSRDELLGPGDGHFTGLEGIGFALCPQTCTYWAQGSSPSSTPHARHPTNRPETNPGRSYVWVILGWLQQDFMYFVCNPNHVIFTEAKKQDSSSARRLKQ